VEDVEFPGEANVVWSDSYHLSAHLRGIPEEGGVGIWEVVFQKNPVTKRGHEL
jgi:hypothetical protein